MLSATHACVSGEQEGTLLGAEWDSFGNSHKLHTQKDETQHLLNTIGHRYELARSGMCFQTGKQELGVGLCGNTNNVTYE